MAQRSSPDYILSVPGYTFIEMLHEGNRSAVYRAVVDESPQCQVVIKLLRSDSPNLSELVQFRNQYTITHNLPISGIVRPLALKPWHNSYALILEDFGFMHTFGDAVFDCIYNNFAIRFIQRE